MLNKINSVNNTIPFKAVAVNINDLREKRPDTFNEIQSSIGRVYKDNMIGCCFTVKDGKGKKDAKSQIKFDNDFILRSTHKDYEIRNACEYTFAQLLLNGRVRAYCHSEKDIIDA